ncbi:hypothetical protein PESHB5_06450 [Pediococcus parvulus]|nr:hypothetical protein PPA04_05070 [Pediococcus parvulus]GHC07226.1 hypothetical protein GCM10008912_08340 [Pediococcus parvulus]
MKRLNKNKRKLFTFIFGTLIISSCILNWTLKGDKHAKACEKSWDCANCLDWHNFN